MGDDNMVFKNLRAIREDKDLSQKVIAEYLKISQNTYSQYETGVISLTAETLIKLAAISSNFPRTFFFLFSIFFVAIQRAAKTPARFHQVFLTRLHVFRPKIRRF